jgi:hypothetical protein
LLKEGLCWFLTFKKKKEGLLEKYSLKAVLINN